MKTLQLVTPNIQIE